MQDYFCENHLQNRKLNRSNCFIKQFLCLVEVELKTKRDKKVYMIINLYCGVIKELTLVLCKHRWHLWTVPDSFSAPTNKNQKKVGWIMGFVMKELASFMN